MFVKVPASALSGLIAHKTILLPKLYVGNLSHTTTEDDLRTLFTQAGPVASVTLIKDRETGASRGFAFVEMNTQVEAEKAISLLNGYNLGDRELKVNLAKPREDRRSKRW